MAFWTDMASAPSASSFLARERIEAHLRRVLRAALAMASSSERLKPVFPRAGAASSH